MLQGKREKVMISFISDWVIAKWEYIQFKSSKLKWLQRSQKLKIVKNDNLFSYNLGNFHPFLIIQLLGRKPKKEAQLKPKYLKHTNWSNLSPKKRSHMPMEGGDKPCQLCFGGCKKREKESSLTYDKKNRGLVADKTQMNHSCPVSKLIFKLTHTIV